MRARAAAAWPGGAAALLGLLLALFPMSAAASTKGKVSGRVVDKEKKQPILAATVALVDQPLGGFTNAQGQYNIVNVPPGTYEVKISRVGFKAMLVQNVVVSADNTTELSVELIETTITTETVVVTAEVPLVEVNLTSSRASLSSREIAALPVQELQDVVNLQAGVVDGHFRGGRLGEVQYQVDGVSVNNAYDNTSSLRIDRSLLQEVQVISGTFDAEYGQAMSGVVNAVLKTGTQRFEWNAEAFGGGFFFPGNATARKVDDGLHPTSIRNFTVTLSGPLGLPKTVFLANGRRFVSDDYVVGQRLYLPTPTYDPENTPYFFPTPGNGSKVVLGYSREWSGALKVTNSTLQDAKLSYQLLFNSIDSRRSTYAFRDNPDGLSQQETDAIAHGLDWTQTFSRSTFLDVSLRQNYRKYEDHTYDGAFDLRYDLAGQPYEIPGVPGVYAWGVDLSRFRQVTDTYLLKASLVSQFTQTQQIKSGLEFQLPEVEFGTPGWVTTARNEDGTLQRHVDEPPDFPAAQRYWPVIGAGFFQDQVELKDLTLRVGARIDYFDARASLPSDLANPANAIQGAPLSVPVPATRKVVVGPRLGVAYPVTDRAGVHFAYGHFYQFPPIGTIFSNADYSILARIQAGTAIDRYGLMGNPNVKPEKTVQYEFGYKQALGRDFGFEVSTFYKDIRDLIGTEFVSTYSGAEYARLTNVDFGTIIGITVAVDHRQLGPVSLAMDYTWQLAQGNSSNPQETMNRAAAHEDPRPRVVPFNWDQRHTFNMTLALAKPDVYSLSAILRAGSGQPYTPDVVAEGYGLEANSGRKPNCAVIDLRGERWLRTRGTRLSVFGRVFNLLDTRFFNGEVFESTGSPYDSRSPGDEVRLNDPTHFYPPRRIEVGITMGPGR